MKTDPQWEKIGKHPHHGISVPLFSLRNQNNCGIGEFSDLILLIDWCKEVGFDVLQLLPLHDTGFDPSPYNPISSCALDPIYISLSELGIEIPENPLSNEPRVLRHSVKKLKREILFLFFEKEYEATSKTDLYQQFLHEHPWLDVYAQFKALKDKYGNIHWQEWDKSMPAPPKMGEFYTFLQYHAFRQMKIVKNYADTQGIKLKGDIPILLSKDSADVWAYPHLFDLDYCVGAPPDLYHADGQNWGFPLINWKAMRMDQFNWWKTRIHAAQNLYHIYRLDHVIGFFRIWAIPNNRLSIEGSYVPPDPDLWENHGTELLDMMIDASPLLPMAEDLGTVPKVVPPVLKKLGICGTRVMRWEKTKEGFIPLNEYEPLSMTTLSNHDMDLLQLWWKKYPTEAVPFAEFLHIDYQPMLGEMERAKILRASHQTSSLFHINPLQEYLALFPELVSLNPEDERINYPGTQLPSNWAYRFRPTLEEIIAHKGLKEAIASILN